MHCYKLDFFFTMVQAKMICPKEARSSREIDSEYVDDAHVESEMKSNTF